MLYFVLFIIQVLFLYFLSRHLARNVHRLFFHLTKNEKWAHWLLAIFFLPGTFLHEIAHFLAALVLLVPVGQIELMPEKWEDGKLKMGSVPVAKTDPLRRAIIGVAPFVLGIVIIFASLSWAGSQKLFDNYLVLIFLGYLIFQVGNTMFTSSKDLEGAWVVVAGLVLVYISLYLLGIRFSLAQNSLLSTRVVDLLKKTDIFLLVPIIIDLFGLTLARFLKRN